jgi:hypothetical protein
VSVNGIESADRAIATVPEGETILARPSLTHAPSDIVAIVDAGDRFGVIGRFGDFALVRSTRGVAGWVLQQ